MPINRRSQSRRAHVEKKARENYRSSFDKSLTDIPKMDKASKPKRGYLKKR